MTSFGCEGPLPVGRRAWAEEMKGSRKTETSAEGGVEPRKRKKRTSNADHYSKDCNRSRGKRRTSARARPVKVWVDAGNAGPGRVHRWIISISGAKNMTGISGMGRDPPGRGTAAPVAASGARKPRSAGPEPKHTPRPRTHLFCEGTRLASLCFRLCLLLLASVGVHCLPNESPAGKVFS